MTSPRYMVDTDICIHAQRPGHEIVNARLALVETGDAVMSVITYGELLIGAEKRARSERAIGLVRAIIALVPVLPLTSEVGAAYGQIRAELERRGTIIGANDLWIAAHALAAGITLVTGHEREFRRVPGLVVENWAAG